MYCLLDGQAYQLNVYVSSKTNIKANEQLSSILFLKSLLEPVFTRKIQPCNVISYIKIDTPEPFAIATMNDVIVFADSNYNYEILPRQEFNLGSYILYPLKNGVAFVSERKYLDITNTIDIEDIQLLKKEGLEYV